MILLQFLSALWCVFQLICFGFRASNLFLFTLPTLMTLALAKTTLCMLTAYPQTADVEAEVSG